MLLVNLVLTAMSMHALCMRTWCIVPYSLLATQGGACLI